MKLSPLDLTRDTETPTPRSPALGSVVTTGGITKTPAATKWWVGSLLSPVIAGAGGLAIGISSPNESDWVGGGVLGPLFIGVVIGCVCSLACTIFSIRKKESLAWVGVMCAIVILGSFAVGVLDVIQSRPR